MILNKIKKFFLKNKKTLLLFSFFILFIFSIGDNTFAVDTKPTADKGMGSFIEGLNLFLSIFSTLLGVLSSLVSLLLNPGWVNGSIFGLDTYLKDIWILISNIVYFIFAFIIIIISFMNIIGQGGGTWELKSALPKFVVGVVMVPFTWFFVQFILSISSFLTVSVLTLPYEVMYETEVFKEAKDFKICKNFEFNLKKIEGKEFDDTKNLEECTDKSKGKVKVEVNKEGELKGDFYTLEQLLKGESGSKGASSSIFSIINIYTYGIMKIQDVKKSTKDQLVHIKDFADLTLKVIFDMFFMIVFLIIMIALFMAMFARGVQLWIHAMFSPLYGLLFFFGKSKEGFGDTKISPLEFIKLAMVPVFVAAALAFGMIFMFTAAHGLSEAQSGGGKIFEDLGNGISALNIGGFTVKVGGIQGGATTANSLFNSLGNGIGQILLEVFSLVILWIAVMAALKSSEITHNVVKPIISFGENIGSLVAKAPQYAPIIPTPGGKISAKGLSQLGALPKTIMDNKVTERISEHKKAMNGLFGTQSVSTKDLTDLRGIVDSNGVQAEELERAQSNIKKNLGKFGLTTETKEMLESFNSGLNKGGSKIYNDKEKLYSGDKLTDYGAKILLTKGFDTEAGNNVKPNEIIDLNYKIAQRDGGKSSTTASDSTTAANKAFKDVKIQNISINESLLKDGKIVTGNEGKIANELKDKMGDIDISKITKDEMKDRLDNLIYDDTQGLKNVIEELERLYSKKFKTEN